MSESTSSISHDTDRIVVIGIAGGSGAGKTTLAKSVFEKLGSSAHVAYLVHDNYYKDISEKTIEERSKTNFDHPDALDTGMLVQHIRDLKQGKECDVPTYDFSTHSRRSKEDGHWIRMTPKKIILVEGILIFSDEDLCKELDVKIFVDAEADIRLLRRMERDTAQRGRTIAQVIQQYITTVRPMHEEFVEPSKRKADIVIHSHGNDKSFEVALRMISSFLTFETS